MVGRNAAVAAGRMHQVNSAVDRSTINRNAYGEEEPHSAEPMLFDFGGTEVDMNPSHEYRHGQQLWYLKGRAREFIDDGLPIEGRPINAAARQSGIAWVDRSSADWLPPVDDEDDLAGLEGLDERPARKQVVGPSGRVYASTSLCHLAVADPPRRWAIRLVEHALFDTLVLVAILCNCATMAWDSPLDPPDTPKAVFIERCEAVYLAIFTVEMLTKILAYATRLTAAE